MGKRRLSTILAIAGFAVLVLAVPGCNNGSGTVTGPATGTAGANITGSWSGAFQSDDQSNCGNSGASATFQQIGSEVTGNLQTSDCGVRGYFKATISGSNVFGSVAMEGCVGGKLSGTINGNTLSLQIADLTKPLVTDDRTIMSGGVVTLSH
ncbi:MAG TPA: hypothetical protein VGQ32_11400 [Thermoanaerobaculia bacterium]|jgi:hypothetical protein|nr:hypothetical protein [Thermoanaerobaculia bacterium]